MRIMEPARLPETTARAVLPVRLGPLEPNAKPTHGSFPGRTSSPRVGNTTQGNRCCHGYGALAAVGCGPPMRAGSPFQSTKRLDLAVIQSEELRCSSCSTTALQN